MQVFFFAHPSWSVHLDSSTVEAINAPAKWSPPGSPVQVAQLKVSPIAAYHANLVEAGVIKTIAVGKTYHIYVVFLSLHQ